MKKTAVLFTALMLLVAHAFAKEKNFPEPKTIVPFTQVDTQLMKELIAGKHPDMAIECAAGTQVPIHSLHHAGLLSMKLSPGLAVTVDKTCYLRFMGSRVYVSLDLVKWDRASNFFEGDYQADLLVEKEGLVVESRMVPYEDDDFDDFNFDD